MGEAWVGIYKIKIDIIHGCYNVHACLEALQTALCSFYNSTSVPDAPPPSPNTRHGCPNSTKHDSARSNVAAGTSPLPIATTAYDETISKKVSKTDKKQEECILPLTSIMVKHDQNDAECSTSTPSTHPATLPSKGDRRMR